MATLDLQQRFDVHGCQDRALVKYARVDRRDKISISMLG